jgi:hypothetical protein
LDYAKGWAIWANALLTGGESWRVFLRVFAKIATAYGVRVQQLVMLFLI